MESLLVCIDFSPLTDRIVDTARGMAQCMSRGLHLVHVQPERNSIPTAVISNTAGSAGKEESLTRRKEVAMLAKLCKRLQDEGIRTSCSTPAGRIDEMLTREAREHNAKMVIMGSHGNGAMYHLVVGSVAEGVLSNLGIPVVLVPAQA
ncbi:universal stress protein [Salinispira pacifica]|uniref:Universal stress protein family n=1 Tax=Salinispira pacifica TaxID=1307761 RepID=V5WIM3_9SPIO|nr:universal stress protein [Salinispira pacifica]AHC15414.1 Universal stress protein family [Salinispira pacifica]